MTYHHKVYVLVSELGTKVGCSRTPEARAKKQGARLVYAREVERDGFAIERGAHVILARNLGHLEGEWFIATEEERAPRG